MAAPALAASMADCAICSGFTGTAGLRPGVSADPVTAHEIMTLRCMPPPCPRLVSWKPTARTGRKPIGGGRNVGMQTGARSAAIPGQREAPRRLQVTTGTAQELRLGCKPAFDALRLASHCA